MNGPEQPENCYDRHRALTELESNHTATAPEYRDGTEPAPYVGHAACAQTINPSAIPPRRHEYRMPTRRFPDADLREIIPAARAGDAGAEQVLFDITERMLYPWSRRHRDFDSITGDVRERLVRYPFDPLWPVAEGTSPDEIPAIVEMRYRRYIALTVRSVAVDRMHAQRELPTEITDTARPVSELEHAPPLKFTNGDATAALPVDALDKILTPKQRLVIALRMKGKTNAEIAESLGGGEGAVKAAVMRARAKINRELLAPAGLRELRHYPNTAYLTQAARRGYIQAVMILSRWYARPEWIPGELPDRYVRLAPLATTAAVIAFKRMHPERILLHKNRSYIDKSDLPVLQEIERQKQYDKPKYHSPPGFTAFPEVARTYQEQIMLNQAVRDGKFSTLKKRGRVYFVPTDEAHAILEKFRLQQR